MGSCASTQPESEVKSPSRVIVAQQAAPAPRRPGSQRLPGDDGEEDEKDGLVVENESGVLNQAEVDETLAQHLPVLTGCYERAGAAQKYVAGPLTLRFLVSSTGHVSNVLVVENRLGNYAVERCLVVEGRRIVFPRPGGNKDAEFDYPLQFRSSGEISVVDWDPDVVTAAAAVPGAAPLLPCMPRPPADVRVVAYIEPGGIVGSVGFVSEDELDAETGVCMAEQIRKWRLPDDRNHVVRTIFPVARLASSSGALVSTPGSSRRLSKRVVKRQRSR